MSTNVCEYCNQVFIGVNKRQRFCRETCYVDFLGDKYDEKEIIWDLDENER